MSHSWLKGSALVTILSLSSLAAAQEPAPFNFAAASAAADDLAARGARHKRAGVALITVAALMDVAATGLAVGSAIHCQHAGSSCRDPFDVALALAVPVHTIALAVGIPLYAVGKSQLSRSALSRPRMSFAPVYDQRGPSGATVQLSFSR